MKAFRTVAIVITLILAVGLTVSAHEMTVMGTVVKVEPTRIQVKTGNEKAGTQPAWYPIDDKPTIKRGAKTVSFTDAKIKVEERVVLLVDHPTKGPTKTKEVRLGTQ